MVLVDTSVWIRFLANRRPWADELDRLLGLGEVAGHELIHGELLIGDRGGRTKQLAAYARMPRAPAVTHDEVVAFVQARRLQGRGASWIDVHLLASALLGGMALWTADARTETLASELGVGHPVEI